jgi:regulator of sigma E protease
VADAQTLRERIRAACAKGRPAAAAGASSAPASAGHHRHAAPVRDGDTALGRIDAFVGQPPEMVTVRMGPFEGLVQGAQRTWEVSVLTVRMLGRMLIGEASLKNLSGPITIADYAGQSVNRAWPTTWASWRWSASAWAC